MRRRTGLRRWTGALALACALLLVGGAMGSAATFALGGDSPREIFDTVLQLVQNYYKDRISEEKLLKGAISGALETLDDPYTVFMSNDDYSEFVDSLQGNVEGIGIWVEQREQYLTVVAPIEGTPAHRAGLEPGDRILEADGVNLVGEPLEKGVKLIRGPVGTKVRLKLERPDEGRTFTVEITRARIEVPIVEGKVLEDGIGYIRIYSFSADVDQRFRRTWDRLRAQGVKGLLVDVRNNGGGYLESAVRLTGAFVEAGSPVVRTFSRGKQTDVLNSPEDGGYIDVPAVVLVNGGTASASEIFAGALRDYGAARLVGEKTFGKGTVQTLITLASGDVLKITTAEYYTPLLNKVDGAGLKPDVEVNNYQPTPDRIQPLELKQVLKLGDVGLPVLAVQQRLNDLGYLAGSENGYFGGPLRVAVQQFQREHDLSATGIVDTQTAEKINQAVAARVQKLKQDDVQQQRALEELKRILSEPDGEKAARQAS